MNILLNIISYSFYCVLMCVYIVESLRPIHSLRPDCQTDVFLFWHDFPLITQVKFVLTRVKYCVFI